MIDGHSSNGGAADSPEAFALPSAIRPGRARRGKVARLPRAIREALNQRLRDGLPASEVLPWLNALPEVRAVLHTRFHGKPIAADNLSWWRRGGFAEWRQQQEIQEAIVKVLSAGRKTDSENRVPTSGHYATVATARAVVESRIMEAMPEGPPKFAACRKLLQSLALLRRKELAAG